MESKKVVIPAKAGMTNKCVFFTFCDFIIVNRTVKPNHLQHKSSNKGILTHFP